MESNPLLLRFCFCYLTIHSFFYSSSASLFIHLLPCYVFNLFHVLPSHLLPSLLVSSASHLPPAIFLLSLLSILIFIFLFLPSLIPHPFSPFSFILYLLIILNLIVLLILIVLLFTACHNFSLHILPIFFCSLFPKVVDTFHIDKKHLSFWGFYKVPAVVARGMSFYSSPMLGSIRSINGNRRMVGPNISCIH